MKKFIIIYIGLLLSVKSLSQNSKPVKVGQFVPASIWSTIPRSVNSKLIILDFWTTTCASCLAAFPKMEKLQQQFFGKLEVVLINTEENELIIKQRLDKINSKRDRARYLLLPDNLSSINGNRVYKELFPHNAVPHHVWINSEGKVLAITKSENTTSENIRSMLSGKKSEMTLKDDMRGKDVLQNGYIQPTVDDIPPVYYSAFVPYYSVSSSGKYSTNAERGTFRSSLYNRSPLQHFSTAFSNGQTNLKILYQLENKAIYIQPKNNAEKDEWRNKYLFSYEIQGRIEDKERVKEKMQLDANYFFGNLFGIEALKEKRNLQSLVFVKVKDNLLTSRSLKRHVSYSDTLCTWTDSDFKSVVSFLQNRFENMEVGRPFIDETNFTGNVDMQLTGNLKDLENVRRQLKQYGLDIIEAAREVEVLVIRDKPGWKPPADKQAEPKTKTTTNYE